MSRTTRPRPTPKKKKTRKMSRVRSGPEVWARFGARHDALLAALEAAHLQKGAPSWDAQRERGLADGTITIHDDGSESHGLSPELVALFKLREEMCIQVWATHRIADLGTAPRKRASGKGVGKNDGTLPEARKEILWKSSSFVSSSALRALLAALEGDVDQALQQVELTTRNAKSYGHYHHAQYDVACALAVLGRTDHALKWLTEAAHNGFPCHTLFERDKLLASVRDDPRFGELMRELRAECDRYRQRYSDLAISSSLGPAPS